MSFEPENCYLASVSDDQTARVWDTNDCENITVFYLTSPGNHEVQCFVIFVFYFVFLCLGVAVCWHKEDTAKLMVCEKIGLVRFYNVHTQQPILSLDHNSIVSFAHWCPFDSQLVGALQQGELVLWDLTRPRYLLFMKYLRNVVSFDLF